MRYIGLDVGTKRIGIAVSDALNMTAQGLESYNVTGDDEQDIDYIIELAKQYQPITYVMGLPRNMNGTYGPMSEKIKVFGARLEEKSGNKVIFWDERLTTVSAERMLVGADVSRKKRRKVVDKIASVLILQSYIDGI